MARRRDPDAFGRELDAIARRGADVIRGHHARTAAGAALDEALMIVVALLSWTLIAHLFGAALSPLQMLPWSLSLGALWVPVRAALASLRSIPRKPSLLEVDRQLKLKDRLTTASEFLGVSEPTPFMHLALQDARDHVDDARTASLATQSPPWSMSQRGRVLALVAVILGVVAVSIGDQAVATPAGSGVGTGTVAEEEPVRDDPPDDQTRPPDDEKKPEPGPTPPSGASPARPGKEAAPPTRDVKKSQGKTGFGRSGDAASSSGKGQARGTPSSQGQSTKSSKERTKKKSKKPKKRDERQQDPDKERKAEEESGHTTGRGAASGSNKSPAASQWSSKDQVTSDDEEDLDDDEEVDDEFDNSDARGGLQPALRDRKPPVNRDLSIGFGNMSNPDANGRGGPGTRKKSRGVASLVLGVPIPDHIKGRPNPGKTKITQERVEPQPEDIAAVKASPRRPRGTPAGHLSNPELAPWMQNLLRTYFGSLRKNSRNRP
ncbi:MAG: hypothetical protein CMJ90_04390 [Planctomycetes bacterium]|nr:hypothetical protein [Planctomycetota bacterium]